LLGCVYWELPLPLHFTFWIPETQRGDLSDIIRALVQT